MKISKPVCFVPLFSLLACSATEPAPSQPSPLQISCVQQEGEPTVLCTFSGTVEVELKPAPEGDSNAAISGDSNAAAPSGDENTATSPPVPPPSIISSKTSGYAPLAVFFQGTEDPFDPQNPQSFDWSFGDPSSGLLDEATGPYVGHTFEQPGEYVVTASAEGITKAVTIEVQDPSGLQTVCVSSTNNFAQCPAGATHKFATSFNEGVKNLETGQRILFRKGDTFQNPTEWYKNTPGPIILSSYGLSSSPLPVIQSPHGDGAINLSGGKPKVSDWIISDLHFWGAGGSAIESQGTVTDLTLHNLRIENMGAGILLSASKPDYYGTPPHKNIAISSCDVDSSSMSPRNPYGLYVSGENLSVYGNKVQDAGHLIRIPFTNALALHNNWFENPGPKEHIVKLHAVALRDGTLRESKNFSVTHNTFIGTGNDWSVAIGPQSSRYNEVVRGGFIFQNDFISGSGNQIQLVLWTQDAVVKDNTFDLSSAQEKTAIQVSRRGIEPPPAGNRVLENACLIDGDFVPCVMDVQQ